MRGVPTRVVGAPLNAAALLVRRSCGAQWRRGAGGSRTPHEGHTGGITAALNAGQSAFDDRSSPVAAVLVEMEESLKRLPDRLRHHAAFLTTYHRTTRAVGVAIVKGAFGDPRWVERWDIAFANLYLEALQAEIDRRGRVPRPWQLASRHMRTCTRCVMSFSGSTLM